MGNHWLPTVIALTWKPRLLLAFMEYEKGDSTQWWIAGMSIKCVMLVSMMNRPSLFWYEWEESFPCQYPIYVSWYKDIISKLSLVFKYQNHLGEQ